MTIGLAELCVIGVVVIVVLLVWNYVAVSRQESREGVSKTIDVDWDAIHDSQVQDFMAKNQKLNAIKRYRELTGLGLKEANDAISYLIKHPNAVMEKKEKPVYDRPDAGIRDLVRDGEIERAVEVYRVFAGVDEYTARDAIREIERELRLGDDSSQPQGQHKMNVADEVHIRDLVRQGNKIEAIKAYRELTGLGLKEAKDAVDAMERSGLL